MTEQVALPTKDAALKIPPHSQEAEQAVLGGLMLAPNAFEQVESILTEADFYRSAHRAIYATMLKLAAQNQPLDLITVSEKLEEMQMLDQAGGLGYLSELLKNTPSAANISAYADIVRERSVLRSLIEVGTDIANSAYQTKGRLSQELLDEAERKVFNIAEARPQTTGPQAISHVLSRTVEQIETLFHSDEPITGVATGFSDLDKLTSGLQAGDLVIVAGRPSMGKTTFAMNIAEYVGIKSEKPVVVFSMEMPSEQLAMRMLSSLGRIDQHQLRSGKIVDTDWSRISSAVGMLSQAPLFIDDTAALSPTEMRARARRLAREHGNLGLIVVDYLQLMKVGNNSENRTAEISEISRSLKALAKELNVPVIALSQLNRSLEQRPNKRPVMADLRESGAIEQDADLIVFIYRDEVYHEDSPDKGIAEIIISKHRNGPTGVTRLTFLGKYTRFDNLAHMEDFADDSTP